MELLFIVLAAALYVAATGVGYLSTWRKGRRGTAKACRAGSRNLLLIPPTASTRP